jgi:hypothetical protein
MIPITSPDRVVTQNANVGRSMNYRLDARNLRHIVTMLRDSVYSNKILAVIREYATNALDAHAAAEEAGVVEQRSKPIEVHLPTKFAPELRIRDFGPGLSTKEIEEIYISLGESTKRQSNKYVGSLGFGCKSAFAYGDRFVVTSWNGGEKTVYNNVLDDMVPEGARCDIMACAPCDPTETGIEICIPIRQEEISECKTTALNFFKYWTVFPTMTGASEEEIKEALAFKKEESIFSGENWVIYPRSTGYGQNNRGIALMGDVPYTLDWELVKRKLTAQNTISQNEAILFDFIQANNSVLTFEIGALEFSVSRETLQYTDFTCTAIFDRVRTMLDSIQKIIEKVITTAPNLWEAKRLYGIIFAHGYYGAADDDKAYRFGGELHRLESYFKTRLKWNGILIESAQFSGIDQWEVGVGKRPESTTYPRYGYSIPDWKPILESYRDDSGKLRKGSTRRRRYRSNLGAIIPDKVAMVVINDLGELKGLVTVMRYLLQRDPKSTTKLVHVLEFGSDKVKKEFYKEYHFDTVPVVSVKSLLSKAKTWYKTVRPARTAAGGPTGPLQVRYSTRDKNKRFGDRYWYKKDVALRELKSVTYFIPVEKGVIRLPSSRQSEPYHVFEAIDGLDRATDWFKKIDTIYGILPRTVTAKWFTDAVAEGSFVNFLDYIKEQIEEMDLTELAEARHYMSYTQQSSYDYFVVTHAFAEAFMPHLKSSTGTMAKLCQALLKSHANLLAVDSSLSALGLSPDTAKVVTKADYKGLLKEAHKQYPLVDIVGRQYFRSGSSSFDKKTMEHLAHYVNLIDGQP